MRLTGTLLALGVGFAVAVDAATLSGPVTGGTRGAPFAAAEVAQLGYVTEEYFLAGEAAAYELSEGEHTPDGAWRTRPAADKASFKTRILVSARKTRRRSTARWSSSG